MPFFKNIESYLPQHMPAETTYYVRATFGAIAAYSITINPIAGALVILGHGIWEYAGLYMQPVITEQEKRFKCYTEAFRKLHEKAKELGTKCSDAEIKNAEKIFFVHNIIEEICYKALADITEELDIHGDVITEEQSGKILAYIKKIAHMELRKPGGYTQKGRQMITDNQFSEVMANITTIIHDRDARLTNARYCSLLDLCCALDDHNRYVKNVLFNSWFRCKDLCCDTHLPMIKEIVSFNKRMTKQVGFNFEHEFKKRRKFYDEHFGSIREAECPKTGRLTALKFVNISRIRAIFTQKIIQKLLESEPTILLTTCLTQRNLLNAPQIRALTEPRAASYPQRLHKRRENPPLLEKNLTVGDFLSTYFPETSANVGVSAAASFVMKLA